MNFFRVVVLALLLAAATVPADAQKLYTWTDDNGVLHITDQPPPKNARIKDVLPYREKTPQELEQIQRQAEIALQASEQEQKRRQARLAEIQARKARRQAQQAAAKAEQEYRQNLEYIRRLSNTRDKRKQFRKKIEKLKKQTEASLAAARAAEKEAADAAAKARQQAEATGLEP